MTDTMHAMAVTGAGPQRVEIPKPAPAAGEVRIKMVASAVNAADDKVGSGALAGRFLHAKTSPLVMGWDVAGTVDALGEGVTDLQEGDAVWGHLAYANTQKQGSYAEFVTLPRDQIAATPGGVPSHVAAAAATCALTSLQSMRDLGGLREGGRVLVIGAGGGVGALAVGIGKRLGARVTGVCSTRDVERVKGFGADEVIDRKTTDPFADAGAYELIFDTPAVHSYGRCASALAKGGAYVTTLPGLSLLTGMAQAVFSSKSCHFVQVVSSRADLELVGSWLADGLQVPIDSRHPVRELGAALARNTAGGRTGRVVVDIEGGWEA